MNDLQVVRWTGWFGLGRSPARLRRSAMRSRTARSSPIIRPRPDLRGMDAGLTVDAHASRRIRRTGPEAGVSAIASVSSGFGTFIQFPGASA